MEFLTDSDINRFWSKVMVAGEQECWPWIAKAQSAAGYGVLKVREHGNIVASRIACYLGNGSPPSPTSFSLHSCDNPSCCNPKHLRWGTPKDNVADALSRERHVAPPDTHRNAEWNAKRLAAMPKGEALWNNSMTEAEAREVFRLHMANHNVSQIAAAVGKPKHVIADICRGRSWRHLTGIPTVEELKLGGVRRGFNQFSHHG